MKKLSYLLSIMMLVFVLQACSTANNDEETKETSDTTDTAEELIILRASDATNLDPHFITDINCFR